MHNLWHRLKNIFIRDKYPQEQYEFLPAYLELMERPPSPMARITAIVLTSIVLIALIWAYCGKLDINITASGELVVPSRSQQIQAYTQSEVTAIYVHNGQKVKAGDELMMLNSVGTDQEVRLNEDKKIAYHLDALCYQTLLSENPEKNMTTYAMDDTSTAAKSRAHCLSIWNHYKAELAEIDAQLKQNKINQQGNSQDIITLEKIRNNIYQRFTANRKLANSNALSQIEFLAREQEMLTAERELIRRQAELKLLQSEEALLKERKAKYIAAYRKEWHEKLQNALKLLNEAEHALIKAHEMARLQVLRAPLDGIVQQMAIHTLGGVVQPAQVLMMISPYDAPQQAEVRIDNRDVGFIHTGQTVTVKVDAYPYSRFGTVSGTVTALSRDAIRDDRAMRQDQIKSPTVFPAQIELKQNYIELHGKKVPLTPGMSVNVEIKVGQRRVIDYIFSPIREYQSEAWHEA